MIVGAANFLVRSKNRTVDHQWFKRFMKRNPQLHARKQKPLVSNRKNSHNLQDMSEYFSKLSRIMREKGIIDDDVWNMDETGFRIDCGRAQLMITLDTRKSLRMTDSDNRDYITSVECISSDGEVIPPLIILAGVHILHK
jgi:trans-2-enoyl-CoA reductase